MRTGVELHAIPLGVVVDVVAAHDAVTRTHIDAMPESVMAGLAILVNLVPLDQEVMSAQHHALIPIVEHFEIAEGLVRGGVIRADAKSTTPRPVQPEVVEHQVLAVVLDQGAVAVAALREGDDALAPGGGGLAGTAAGDIVDQRLGIGAGLDHERIPAAHATDGVIDALAGADRQRGSVGAADEEEVDEGCAKG